jgi:hypothetical protein
MLQAPVMGEVGGRAVSARCCCCYFGQRIQMDQGAKRHTNAHLLYFLDRIVSFNKAWCKRPAKELQPASKGHAWGFWQRAKALTCGAQPRF